MNENALQYATLGDLDLSALLRQFSTQWTIVNLGVIKKIHNEDYVDVRLNYLDNTETESTINDVRLLHIGTATCKLNIEPTVGDNVLLLCPRDFVAKLNYNEPAESPKFLTSPYSESGMCGILIKAESDDNVKTTVKIDKEGNITFETDGDVDVSVGGDASASVTGDSSLETTGDRSEKITGDYSVEVDGDYSQKLKTGLLEIGNDIATLGGMISDLLDALSSADPVTYGSPASHMFLPSFTSKISAIKAKWEQVFE